MPSATGINLSHIQANWRTWAPFLALFSTGLVCYGKLGFGSLEDFGTAIEKALKAGGNKDFTVKELPGLNHLFQTCKTGAVSEYGKIEETLAPAVLEMVAEWILKRVK